MRIEKTIKGEKFPFHVYFKSGTMTAEVKWYFGDAPVIGKITEDFKYIVLPDDYMSPYISGVGRVKVGKLKLNKYMQREARDYNNGTL